MRIGIDISQVMYSGTGVGEYIKRLVISLIRHDKENEYVLFFSSLRRRLADVKLHIPNDERIEIKQFRIPPTLLNILWNRLGVFPIEWFIGDVDVFISSDWTQPGSIKAKLVTVVHDLSPLKFPKEHHSRIVNVHKRRLKRVKKLCDAIICDSESTKKDLQEIMQIPESKLHVIYPGGKV